MNFLHHLEVLQGKKIPKIQDTYGSGWVGPGLSQNKKLENRPKKVLNQYWYFGVVYHVYFFGIYIRY